MPCHARHVNNTCCLTNKPWFLHSQETCSEIFKVVSVLLLICTRAVLGFGELTESCGRHEGKR